MKALSKLVLKCSIIGGVAVLTVAAGCSDSNKDETTGAGGDSGTTAGKSATGGGDSKAGSPGAGGDHTTPAKGAAGGGGAGEGGAGEGGAGGGAPELISAGGGGPDIPLGVGGDNAGGAGTGPAVAKFCNDLTFGVPSDPQPTTMILEIGEGASKVTFTAVSGECVPADGEACTMIPIGTDVPINMFDADAPDVALDSGTADIKAGEDWIFWTDVDKSGAEPAPVFGGDVSSQVACEDITYADVY